MEPRQRHPAAEYLTLWKPHENRPQIRVDRDPPLARLVRHACSIEINLAGAVDTLPSIRDPDTRAAMRLAIDRMCKELCRARARYQSFLQPGQRCTWDMA